MVFKSLLIAALSGLLPMLAWAHTGVDAGAHHDPFWVGFFHPLGGLDHIAVAIAIGVWATRIDRRVWVTPLIFVSSMTLGAWVGMQNIAFPSTEWLIAASVLFCATLPFARQSTFWRLGGLSSVVFFALAHGLAHGSELASDSQRLWTLAGLVICTAGLHGCGIVLQQRLIVQRPVIERLLGVALSLLGLELLLSLSGVLA